MAYNYRKYRDLLCFLVLTEKSHVWYEEVKELGILGSAAGIRFVELAAA